jgi:leucyl-tRNA synthetase
MAARVRAERRWNAAVGNEAQSRGLGKHTVTYHMRDWLISRQRYWGTPIPIVYCDLDGIVPVPEEQLPVLLPQQEDFRPKGESPLAANEAFVNTTCPQCGRPARRETDTMDTFVDSSWYFMRYINPRYDKGPVDPEAADYWLPVDQYTGGAEHAVKHLLYARFFWKVCRDLGLVTGHEPFIRLFNQGIILAEDRQKMSKSRPDYVVAPDELVSSVGADPVRAFLMFIGPWEQGGSWSSRGMQGISRWLNRVWNLLQEERKTAMPAGADEREIDRREFQRRMHHTIRKVDGDLESFRFNTAIAALMEYTNYLQDAPAALNEDWDDAIDNLLRLMAPLTPHIAEELWALRGKPYSIHHQAFPAWDETLAAAEDVTLIVQVNGRLRDRIVVPVAISEDDATKVALESERIQQYVSTGVERVIYVPGRIINIVTK